MTKRTIFATAAAVFAVGTFAPAAFAQVQCAGANACKGQSACKSAKSPARARTPARARASSTPAPRSSAP